MPCFVREKNLPVCPRRRKQNDRDVTAPKPVHPRALKYHGLFGVSFVRQHEIVDERWTPNSLSQQFGGMTDLLSRHVVFKRHETKANRQRYFRESKRLKLQCRDGLVKLHNILTGDNVHTIHNFLIDHRDMQRLYLRMPIHLVVDNINQRTFVLRKERDRLECRLGQLKHRYREMLLDRAVLENRIKYQNEFVLEEEVKSRVFVKKIENSNVRLKAIKTINNTYKKMIQVLVHDAIFYEPILRSLDADMEDQSNFIKHILHLGMPAISKFKELNAQYRQLESKSRLNLLEKQHMLASLQAIKPAGSLLPNRAKQAAGISASADPKRYLRETKSMMMLKNVLEAIEKTINEIKIGTLCSQAMEIYPRMKSQADNNQKLRRLVQYEMMTREMLEDKMKSATVLEGVLINNLSEEEINRFERIKDLKATLRAEEKFEQDTLQYIKNRGDAYVMFRVNLWNLIEILRHVGRHPRTFQFQYPNSYLKLPLLKFDMLNMFAAPPKLYEEDTEKIMSLLKRKIYKLMQGYNADMESKIKSSKEKYHVDYLGCKSDDLNIDGSEALGTLVGEDLLQEHKTLANIPSRKQIKAQSNRIIDDAIKREES